jgi:putative copper resistance protein D
MVLTTSYGILLAAKLALVMVMLLCAARNASIGRRYAILVGRPMDQSSSVPRSLQFSLALEAAAATAVLAAVAVLGTLSPADWAADR